MDSAAMWLTVRNRALDDDGAAGLFATGSELVTGIFDTAAPSTQPMPYVIWQIESDIQTDAFRLAKYDVNFLFHVYVKTDPVVSAAAYERGSKIINRLRGNWQAQTAGTAPTFGFHRWSEQTAGDWTLNSWSHKSSITQHTNTELHWIERYFALCQQPAA